MKSRCLVLLLFASTVTFATTLTVNLDAFDDATPGRHANLSITDGNSSFGTDLFHYLFVDGLPLGHCVGLGTASCNFTPGGDVTKSNIPLGDGSNPFSFLVLNGVTVPFSQWSDFVVSFSLHFAGGTAIQAQSGTPWGPQALKADLGISVVQLSTGECVFCANAPNALGSASGINYGGTPYSNFAYNYNAAGTIIPEPGYKQVVLPAIALLLLFHKSRTQKQIGRES